MGNIEKLRKVWALLLALCLVLALPAHAGTVEIGSPELRGGVQACVSGGSCIMEEGAVSGYGLARASRTEELDDAIEQAMAVLDEDMSDLDKALVLHDYLAINCEYSMDVYLGTGNPGRDVYTAYGALVDKVAVCQGYAEAYKALLAAAGIDSVVVISTEMNHAWNLINIDGEWYHVDVTWDDPVPPRDGFCMHEFFLCSDDAISNNETFGPHYGWNNKGITCDSKRFDSGYAFSETIMPMYWQEDGTYYYVDSQTLYRGMLNESGTAVVSLLDMWEYSIVWSGNDLYYVVSEIDYTDDTYSDYGYFLKLMRCDLTTYEIAAVSERVLFDISPSADSGFPELSDCIGLKIDETGEWIEGWATLRQTLSIKEKLRRYPAAWDNLTLPGDAEVLPAGLVLHGEQVAAGMLLSEGHDAAAMWLAFYRNGKMVSVKLFPVIDETTGLFVANVDLAELSEWDEARLIITREDYTPCCSSVSFERET